MCAPLTSGPAPRVWSMIDAEHFTARKNLAAAVTADMQERPVVKGACHASMSAIFSIAATSRSRSSASIS